MFQETENRHQVRSRWLRSRKFWASVLVIAALVSAHSVARAAVDTGVNRSYDGTAPKSSVTPWVDSLFQDMGHNTVRLTITTPNLSNPEFLKSLYLNFNDTKNVTLLSFTPVFSLWEGVNHNYNLQLSPDGERASTGGAFDILLNFVSSPGRGEGPGKEHLGAKDSGRGRGTFDANDQVVFDITTSQAETSLSSLDFAFKSMPGSAGSFYEAAFIQRTGLNHNDSDFAGATSFSVLGVPEPAWGLAAAGLCIAGFALGGRRMRAPSRKP